MLEHIDSGRFGHGKGSIERSLADLGQTQLLENQRVNQALAG